MVFGRHCLTAPAGTLEGAILESADGGTCVYEPKIVKTPLEPGLSFDCTLESLEACRQISGHANNAIATDGACYAVTR
jgi:hypothetical protein